MELVDRRRWSRSSIRRWAIEAFEEVSKNKFHRIEISSSSILDVMRRNVVRILRDANEVKRTWQSWRFLGISRRLKTLHNSVTTRAVRMLGCIVQYNARIVEKRIKERRILLLCRHSLRLCKSRHTALKILAWKRILQLIFFPRWWPPPHSATLIHFVREM